MSLKDLLDKQDPRKQRHRLCVVLGSFGSALILFTGDEGIEDYVSEIGGSADDNGLDDPPSLGVWMWEGTIGGGEYDAYNGDYHYTYLTGKYRRPTEQELAALQDGKNPLNYEQT